jgi:hypothetical protein
VPVVPLLTALCVEQVPKAWCTEALSSGGVPELIWYRDHKQPSAQQFLCSHWVVHPYVCGTTTYTALVLGAGREDTGTGGRPGSIWALGVRLASGVDLVLDGASPP